MYTFNNTEEEWFCSWVVMRRKYLVSIDENEKLRKTIRLLRNTENDLKQQIVDLEKSRKRILKKLYKL